MLQYHTSHGLLDTLVYPNAIERRITREEKRNLPTKISYWRSGSTNDPVKVEYSYDSLARPSMKKEFFNTVNPELSHHYSYNERSELIAEVLNKGGNSSYTYDNIGNRTSSQEALAAACSYTSTALNQYSRITQGSQSPFVPSYDADGNQSTLQTSTGEWAVSYNVLNQATSFTQGSKRILCVYDYLNRRIEKALYEGDSLSYRKRFIYRGYLQIAELDASTENAIPRKTYLWDPSETNASRVLVMSLFDATGSYEEDLYYTHDAQKNTNALFGIKAGRRALYQYGAYGNLIKIDGDLAALNPFRFSSEYHDDELALIYYNYRYLNPKDGRWINRDPIQEQGGINLYGYVKNNPILKLDYVGLDPITINIQTPCEGIITGSFESHSNGVVIDLNYSQDKPTKKECCCKSWRWQQTVWTNSPLGGTTSPYNDPRPNDDNKPWYWTDAEYINKKKINGTTFYDKPSRAIDSNTEIYWRAELVLKCLDQNDKVTKDLAFLYYGFHVQKDGSITTNSPTTRNGK